MNQVNKERALDAAKILVSLLRYEIRYGENEQTRESYQWLEQDLLAAIRKGSQYYLPDGSHGDGQGRALALWVAKVVE